MSKKRLDVNALTKSLQPIVGEPLTGVGGSFGHMYEFGTQYPAISKHGKPISQSDLVIEMVSDDWRVIQAGRILFGSSDHGYSMPFWIDDDVEIPYNVEAKQLAKAFLLDVGSGKFVAESVSVGAFADVTICCSHEVVIQCFSSTGLDKHAWFFHNRRTDEKFLVGPTGINGADEKRRRSKL